MNLRDVGFLSILGGATSTLPNGLLAYWNFDQAAGADEPDLKGNIGDLLQLTTGTDVGSSVGPNGINLSRTFVYDSGTSDTNALAVDTTIGGTFPLSINFWIRIDVGADGGSGALPFNFNEVTTWGPPASIYLYFGTSYWTMNDNNESSVIYYNDSNSYADGNWYMWTLVVRADLTFEVWINGVLQSFPNAGFDNPPLTGTDIKPFDSISFGRSIYLGSLNSNDGFAGAISMAGIWNRDLSSSEITQLYNGGNGLTYIQL